MAFTGEDLMSGASQSIGVAPQTRRKVEYEIGLLTEGANEDALRTFSGELIRWKACRDSGHVRLAWRPEFESTIGLD
jgi:hypothetical protein